MEAPDSVNRRVTVPRAAAGGLLLLGFKKNFERCYVIITLVGGFEDIFEIPGYSTMRVRTEIAPAVTWMERYGADVRAAAGYEP